MNKKIIAIAIATAMAAPVAMADIKMSGQVGVALVNAKVTTTNNAANDGRIDDSRRTLEESGFSKIDITGTSGMGFAKAGLNLGSNLAARGSSTTSRDTFVGLKGGWGKFQVGTMSGAVKGLEGDKFNATFLQVRKGAGVGQGAYGSDGFVNSIMEYSNKFGPVSLKVQMGPESKDGSTATDGESYNKATGEDYVAIQVKGKAGPVDLYAATNTYSTFQADTATTPDSQVSVKNTNTKFGAKMKFGALTVTAQAESNKTGSTDTGANAQNAYTGGTINRQLLMANMGLGNGLSVDLALGNNSAVDGRTGKGSFTRFAVAKQLDKGTSVYAGYWVNDIKNKTTAAAAPVENEGTGSKTTKLGVGIRVKF